MRSLWERAPRRGECGKSAIRGILIGVALAVAAITAGFLLG